MKDKAKELVEKFMGFVEMEDFYGDDKEVYNAKQCALICVDEILTNKYDRLYLGSNDIEFWEEVKQEIEKL